MQNTRYIKFAAAAVIYAGFAVYLYQPYFKGFDAMRGCHLFVVNVSLAGLGCYVLTRRWVSSFFGSLLAGAIYGFGPFLLGLAKFHPTAGLLAAAVPWLFLPAAFWPRRHRRLVCVPLSTLPFLAIVLFFQVSTRWFLFAVPAQAGLRLPDLAGLLAPLVTVNRSLTLWGFYHIPIAALVMALLMLLAARRFGIMIILTVGVILAFCDCLFNVSPIMWLAIPMLCGVALIGVGIQAMSAAGFADRKWLLLTSVIMAVLAIVMLLVATKYFQVFAGLGVGSAKLLVKAAQMYILGAVAVVIIFFLARAKLRLAALRLVILCSTIAIDIFVGARFIVDRIF